MTKKLGVARSCSRRKPALTLPVCVWGVLRNRRASAGRKKSRLTTLPAGTAQAAATTPYPPCSSQMPAANLTALPASAATIGIVRRSWDSNRDWQMLKAASGMAARAKMRMT